MYLSDQYIKTLSKILDPYQVTKGVYSRKHCYRYNSEVLKDLTFITKDMSNVVLIDNTPSAFYLQPANGIIVSTFTENKYDHELIRITKTLLLLTTSKDIRTPIANETRCNAKIKFTKHDLTRIKEYTLEEKIIGYSIINSSLKMDTFQGYFNDINTLMSGKTGASLTFDNKIE